MVALILLSNPLIDAVKKGNTAKVVKLLQKGYNPNTRDRDHPQTPPLCSHKR